MRTSTIITNSNVYLEDGQLINSSTALLPFRDPSGAFWTTDSCKDTTSLGYVYPETQYWNFNSTASFRANVTATVAKLYGAKTRSLLTAQHHAAIGAVNGPALLGHDNTFTDWTIESEAPAGSLPPTFIVRFSLTAKDGAEGVDVGSWLRLMPATQQQQQQQHNTHKHDDVRGRASSASSEQRIRGTTGLTTHLIDAISAGDLASLASEYVVPFLTERLSWTVSSVCFFLVSFFLSFYQKISRAFFHPSPLLFFPTYSLHR